MSIITLGDIRRGSLAVILIIIPTVLLVTYTRPALQLYQITGLGLYKLKLDNVPDEVIEPLHVLRLKSFFYKFSLMSEVESRIDNTALFNKYKKEIMLQLKTIPIPASDYIFLATLGLYYYILLYTTRKWFTDENI